MFHSKDYNKAKNSFIPGVTFNSISKCLKSLKKGFCFNIYIFHKFLEEEIVLALKILLLWCPILYKLPSIFLPEWLFYVNNTCLIASYNFPLCKMKHERLLSLLLIAQAEIDKTRYTLIAYSASRKKNIYRISNYPLSLLLTFLIMYLITFS